MHIKITTALYKGDSVAMGSVHEVLLISNDSLGKVRSYLIDVKLGASYAQYANKAYEVVSTNYQVHRHQRGDYGWVRPSECEVTLLSNRNSLHLLKED